MPPSLSGTVLKKKWKLGALVGTGGCAEVYEACHVQGSGGTETEQFVAKIAPLPVGLPPAMNKGKKRKKTDQEKHADMIYYEYTLYKGFLLEHGGVVQIPTGGYGEDKNLRFLVMTRLGPDVEAAQKQSAPWSVARKAGYARLMLDLVRSLHEKCKMIFVDVKPENFMFGLPGSPDADKIFLIDFGLSFRFTGREGSIKPQSNSAQVQGTPEFLSLKCHGGASAGRCDDLESLGYVILSMLKEGSSPLPWSGSTSVANGLATKKSTSLETLCRGCPVQMLQYMKDVRGMDYEDTPDYDALDALLQAMQKSGGSATAAKSGGGGRSAAGRGENSSAQPKAASAKPSKGKAKPTPDAEISEAKAKGKKKEAAPAMQPAGGPAPRRSGRRCAAPEEDERSPSPAAARRKTGGGGGGGRGEPRKASKRGKAGDGDEEAFFDAREDEDGDGELEAVKVTSGAAGKGGVSRKAGTGASSGAAGAQKSAHRGAAAQKEFVLKVCGGPHDGQSLSLAPGGAEVRVGRNAPRKNGLRLDKDLEVSDKHAVLRPQADGILCEDVGSLNGSFVNEDRLEGAVVLKNGDVLQVGQSAVRVTR